MCGIDECFWKMNHIRTCWWFESTCILFVSVAAVSQVFELRSAADKVPLHLCLPVAANGTPSVDREVGVVPWVERDRQVTVALGPGPVPTVH